MSTAENKAPALHGVKDGEIFRIAGLEFIKFPSVDGKTPVVMKDIAFRSAFGNSNDFKESDVLKRLESEVLPKIAAAIGEENLCTIKTDLTTWDGLKVYGELESLISIPTMDFYRANVEIFDKYKPNAWWWLATADSANPHYDPIWVLCVAPAGDFSNDDCNGDGGVRPFFLYKSSIFESSEQ